MESETTQQASESQSPSEGAAFPAWVKEFFAGISVCDCEGVILQMNDQSARIFADYGGRELISSNALDCHPEPARSKLETLLATQGTNIYTIEKAGVHKLICQAPWYVDGVCRGLVELSMEIPATLPHYVRDPNHPA
jgi:transcriptional regulator with PAS, ATPase and Fis domain